MSTNLVLDELKDARVLIVDDEPLICDMLAKALYDDGCFPDSCNSGEEALELIKKKAYETVLTDVRMPGMGGIELSEEIHRLKKGIPVIIVTAIMEMDTAINAIRVGALDYIPKPASKEQLRHAIRKGISLHRKRPMDIPGHFHEIDEHSRYEELTDAQKFSLSASVFVEAIEANTSHFERWSQKVAEVCIKVGKALKMSAGELGHLRAAAMLHDLGNLKVENELLEKDGTLTDEEMEEFKKHPEVSAGISAKLNRSMSEIVMIRHHHECFDGSGYPQGLKGNEIPIGSRILAVGDAYIAMKSDRPHREAISHEIAVQEIRKCSGKQFDPKVVEQFIIIIEKMHGL